VPILAYVIGDEFGAVLAAAQGGNEDDFAALWRDVNPVLLRYLRVIAPAAAEDIAGETWVQVVRGLPGFRGDEQAWRAWLFTTARRRAADEVRRRSRHPVVPLAEATGELEPRTGDAAGLAMENLATAAAIAAVSSLPRLQAEVVLLRVLGGLDTEAVGRIVGRSPGAVRVAAHRGLRRLAQTLAKPGVTL
jgi:RNA polymerase sigma-70 factor (ECF subfamily)